MSADDPLIVGYSCLEGAHEWLRCQQALHVMGKAGKKTAFVPNGAKKDEVGKWLYRADIFCSGQGVGSATVPWYFRWRDEMYHETGRYIPIVWDVDDTPDFISPWNSAYDCFGTEEVDVVDPDTGQVRKLWEDGVDGFDIFRNKTNIKAYKFMLGHVDALTVTQPYLADHLRKYNQHIEILPNYADFESHFRFRNKPQKDGLVRIIYQGGSSHFSDWKFVAPVIKSLTKQYPHIRLVCFGDTRRWANADLGEEFVIPMHSIANYRSFCMKMGTMGVDIGIAPLNMESPHEAEFNRCKSCLKWLDYAAAGIPCVAQNDIPYSPVINFSPDVPDLLWNGMLAGTHEEWYLALSVLIENPTMRELIGSNAYQTAYREWNSATKGEEIFAMYKRILDESEWHGDTDCSEIEREIVYSEK